MAESKKTTSPRHIADVTHADKTVPSDTSRPVIVTNRAILKDPMMAEVPTKPELSGKKLITTPLEVPGKLSTESTESFDKQPEKSQQESTVSAPQASSDEIPVSAIVKTDDRSSSSKSVPDDPTAEATKDPEASADIAASKQAEHKAAVQKLIVDKQYLLPINSVEKRRSKRFVALGIILSLVLAVAWIDVALDANLIQVSGIKAPTHFFSN